MSASAATPRADDVLALWAKSGRRPELLPLLHGALERADRLGALPAETRDRARQAYYVTLARSRSFRRVLDEVLDAAEAEGAPLLPLKGALLAFALYPSPAERPMADVDVAALPGDVERVARRLEDRGFVRLGADRRRYALSHHHHYVLVHRDGTHVDLHARLSHELGALGRVEPLVRRAIPVRLETPSRMVLAPSWPDHLFYVALHAATHTFAQSALWLADLLLLAPRVDDPARVLHTAREQRAEAALHFALARARESLPVVRLRILPPPPHADLRARALRAALGEDPLSRAPSLAASLLARVALTDRPEDAARALLVKTRLRLIEALIERPNER